MAGTIRGKIDCLSSTGSSSNNAQEMFKAWYDFMESLVTAGVVTRVALQYGNSGTGTDYHDGTNPFEPNAFGVYRWPSNVNRDEDIYVMVQWADSLNGFGSPPGNPGKLAGTSGSTGGKFGIQWACAFESDGTTPANPWTGGTAGDGTDQKGATPGTGPVWEAPVGGTLAVWPLSNTGGRGYDTNKENAIVLFNRSGSSTSNVRYGFLADDDSFGGYIDYGDNGGSDWFWFGPVRTTDGASFPFEVGLMRHDSDLDNVTFMGDDAGTDQDTEGGMYNPQVPQVDPVYIGLMRDILVSSVQPSEITATVQFEEWPVWLFYGAGLSSEKGFCGEADTFVRSVYGVPDRDTSTDLARYVTGNTSSTTINPSLPWDGATTPGSTGTRAGVSF